MSTAEQYAVRRPASAPRPGTQPASTCSLPGCDPPPSERRGPWHPGQIFLACSRFSHLLRRNKTWDTSSSSGLHFIKRDSTTNDAGHSFDSSATGPRFESNTVCLYIPEQPTQRILCPSHLLKTGRDLEPRTTL